MKRFSSSLHSRSGNSVTHTKRYSFLSRRSICFASSRRSAPRTSQTSFFLSAANRSRSPGFTVHSCYKSVHLLICHEFCKGRLYWYHPPAIAIYARPFAPYPFANSTNLSIFLRGMLPWPSALIPRTLPPFARAPVNTAESAVLHNISYIMKFHAKSHIRFVRAETIHCFLPGHSLDWKLHIHTKNLFEQVCKQISHLHRLHHPHQRRKVPYRSV